MHLHQSLGVNIYQWHWPTFQGQCPYLGFLCFDHNSLLINYHDLFFQGHGGHLEFSLLDNKSSNIPDIYFKILHLNKNLENNYQWPWPTVKGHSQRSWIIILWQQLFNWRFNVSFIYSWMIILGVCFWVILFQYLRNWGGGGTLFTVSVFSYFGKEFKKNWAWWHLI